MKQIITLGAAVLALAFLISPAAAQGAGAPVDSSGRSLGNHMGQNNMTQEQFNKIGDYVDQAKRLTKEDKAKGKTVADLQAEDKAAATALVKALPLSCEVTDAVLAAEGPVKGADGKDVDTKTYEVACANGMGYFLISQEPGKPYGFSCFAADATRDADVAAGRQPGAVCGLGANHDSKNAAMNLLMRAGINCLVSKTRNVGVSSKANLEYNEVACSDGKGYMLITAVPGSIAPVRTTTCHDAAQVGLLCKLTDSGVPLVTKQTLIDALAAHNVPCAVKTDKMRVVGQETAKKRYVVEFLCPEQPKGLIAFIPLTGSTAPFEALDCKAAAKRSASCRLTAPAN